MDSQKAHSNLLKELAENLHIIIGYEAKEPKRYEFAFLLLTMLMHLADSAILSAEEENKISEELSSIKYSLLGGSLKINDIEESLLHLLKKIQDTNAKIKILCSMVELEHLVSIDPCTPEQKMQSSLFDEKIAPLRDALSKDLSSIEATLLYKTIEEAKKDILSKGETASDAIDNITQQADRILRGDL